MKQLISFVGWDFVGVDNGTNDIWRMCVDGIEYPKLYRQFPTGDFTCPDGVEMLDLIYFCNHWLAEGDTLRCDIAPSTAGDGIVNLFDYMEFSRYWLLETEP
jgi:hypothetical protein